MTRLSDYVPAVVVYWTGSEAGWGPSDEGMTVFRTEHLAKKAIDKHLADEKALNPSGEVPSFYIRPSEPQICLITKEKRKELPKNSGRFTSERNPTWFKVRL